MDLFLFPSQGKISFVKKYFFIRREVYFPVHKATNFKKIVIETVMKGIKTKRQQQLYECLSIWSVIIFLKGIMFMMLCFFSAPFSSSLTFLLLLIINLYYQVYPNGLDSDEDRLAIEITCTSIVLDIFDFHASGGNFFLLFYSLSSALDQGHLGRISLQSHSFFYVILLHKNR